jgi:hypothetical protein
MYSASVLDSATVGWRRELTLMAPLLTLPVLSPSTKT